MKNVRNKIKRQIELLGRVLSTGKPLTIADLASEFNCEELTIKRDMQDLRASGLIIHSYAKRGVVCESDIGLEKINDLLSNYFSVTTERQSFTKATALLARKLKLQSISLITHLQQVIDKSLIAEISYKKSDFEEINRYTIEPMLIFQSDNNWRLLAREKGKVKQFLIERITEIIPSEKNFRKPSHREIMKIFKTSFRSWIGDDRYKIKLLLCEPWASRIKPKQLLEVQQVIENDDGSIIFEAIVNSLGEIASWIVSRGSGVKVLEPKELKKEVIKIAKGVLSNYNEKEN